MKKNPNLVRTSLAVALGAASLTAPQGALAQAGLCPAGLTPVSQSGNAVAITAETGVLNPTRALGTLASAGTSPPDSASAEINDLSDSLTLDLGVIAPQNAILIVSAARDNGAQGNTARVEVFFSPDNVAYTSGGTYGAVPASFPSTTQNVLERSNLIVPAGGARYIRFQTLDNDDIFIDGVEYDQICVESATLLAVKTAAAYGPGAFATPGADVVYTITVQNLGAGPADADSVFIVGRVPPEAEFYNSDVDGAGPQTGAVGFTQAAGTGLSFNPATDIRYSNLAAPPANFAACVYAPVAGYDPAVRHVCVNPKGTMQGGAPTKSFSVFFRARIK